MSDKDYYQVRLSIPFDHPIYGDLARYLEQLGRGDDAKAMVFLGAMGFHIKRGGGAAVPMPAMNMGDVGLVDLSEINELHQELDEQSAALFD